MESNQAAPIAPQVPAGAPVAPAPAVETKLNVDPVLLEKVNAVQLQALKEKQKLKKERDDFQRQQKEWQDKMTAWEQEFYAKTADPSKQALEEMEKQGKYVSPEELEEQIKNKILTELEQTQEKKKKQTEEETHLNNFKKEINDLVDKEYPAIKISGASDYIYQVIIEDLQGKIDEYGYEEGSKMVMSKEEAAKKVNDYIDSQFDSLLQSEQARSYLIKKLKLEQPSQGNPKTPLNSNTLTNDFTPGSADPRPKALTREESIARAAKMIKFR